MVAVEGAFQVPKQRRFAGFAGFADFKLVDRLGCCSLFLQRWSGARMQGPAPTAEMETWKRAKKRAKVGERSMGVSVERLAANKGQKPS